MGNFGLGFGKVGRISVKSRDEWIIIGISGVTCGGKTTLARTLEEVLHPVYVFNQDKYFYPDDSPRHVKCDGIDHNNYDILSSLDMEQMYEDVLATMNGDDKSLMSRLEEGKNDFKIQGKKFIILEGFTALNFKPILDICDLRYYIVLDYETCVARRTNRVYDPPDVPGYFEQCVWPNHVTYRREIEKDARVKIIDGKQDDAYDIVMSDLRTKINYK